MIWKWESVCGRQWHTEKEEESRSRRQTMNHPTKPKRRELFEPARSGAELSPALANANAPHSNIIHMHSEEPQLSSHMHLEITTSKEKDASSKKKRRLHIHLISSRIISASSRPHPTEKRTEPHHSVLLALKSRDKFLPSILSNRAKCPPQRS